MFMMKRSDFEIMAPVGSYDSLTAAIQGGADSVYFGIEGLNMRARSSNNGERPDGNDWQETGPVFRYLQSQGFRIFASVGINSFSYIKKDISAVICDRLHPDGTTLRGSDKVLGWYSQFYDARDIIDLEVRPQREVRWTPKT